MCLCCLASDTETGANTTTTGVPFWLHDSGAITGFDSNFHGNQSLDSPKTDLGVHHSDPPFGLLTPLMI